MPGRGGDCSGQHPWSVITRAASSRNVAYPAGTSPRCVDTLIITGCSGRRPGRSPSHALESGRERQAARDRGAAAAPARQGSLRRLRYRGAARRALGVAVAGGFASGRGRRVVGAMRRVGRGRGVRAQAGSPGGGRVRASWPVRLVAGEVASGSSRVAAAGESRCWRCRLAGRMCMAMASACGGRGGAGRRPRARCPRSWPVSVTAGCGRGRAWPRASVTLRQALLGGQWRNPRRPTAGTPATCLFISARAGLI